MLKRLWNYIEGINGLILILYSIFVFVTAVYVNDNFSIYYFLFSLPFIIVLSVIICPAVLRLFAKSEIQQSELKFSAGAKYCVIIKIALFIIPFLIFFVYYISFSPGGWGVDPYKQYLQAISNEYVDWHPVIHTLIAFKLPLFLTGGWVGSIALFQITCVSLVLGYAFLVILRYTNFKYTLISAAFILLNPQLGYYVMWIWKDVWFMMGALLLLLFSLQIFFTKGEWIKAPSHMIFFIIVAALTTLIRHNAILFTVPMVIAVLFYTTKKRGLIVCLSIIILCLGIKLPLYSALGVEAPDKRLSESLGLPMTIIGASVAYAPQTLDEETKEFAYKIASKEVWEENYKYGSFNSVKWDKESKNEVIDEYGFQKVISMMFRCIKNAKKVSLKALIKLTESFYTITERHNSPRVPTVAAVAVDIKKGGIWQLKKVLKGYNNFVSDAFPHVFLYLGVMHLLLIVSILAKCRLNRFRDWKKIFLIAPVFFYNGGSTFLLSGVSDGSRFFFYTFLAVPILLIILFRKEPNRVPE